MNFYWPSQGRQVRVAGPVAELSAEASARDWADRPRSDGSSNPDWQLYAVQPDGDRVLAGQQRPPACAAQAGPERHTRGLG